MSKNANPASITINGEDYGMNLTLGGLAALERKLGTKNLKELTERLSDPSINDIQEIALTLIRCGGENVPDDFFMLADVEIAELSRCIGQVVAAKFKAQKGHKPGNAAKA